MRRFFIACTLPALLACGRRQGRLPGPPPDMQVEAPALDTWPLMREAARIAADSGRFDEADRMLAAYIAGRPGTDEVNEAALARALLLVDPRNPAASTAAAVDALGTLLRRSPDANHADATLALRRALLRVDSLERVVRLAHDSAQVRDSVQKAESARLTDELAKVREELDRVKRRLSGRPPA
jgi:hypothetical protein